VEPLDRAADEKHTRLSKIAARLSVPIPLDELQVVTNQMRNVFKLPHGLVIDCCNVDRSAYFRLHEFSLRLVADGTRKRAGLFACCSYTVRL